MRFSLKKWPKIQTKAKNRQKNAIFDYADFCVVMNYFGEMWEDFSHNDIDDELREGVRMNYFPARWRRANFSERVNCFLQSHAHLTACWLIDLNITR